MPRLFNRRTDEPASLRVYIGRPSKWGNPWEIGKDKGGTRAEVIAKYEAWFMAQPDLVALAKRELAGRDLVCWCSPLPCHGDVLLRVANEP